MFRLLRTAAFPSRWNGRSCEHFAGLNPDPNRLSLLIIISNLDRSSAVRNSCSITSRPTSNLWGRIPSVWFHWPSTSQESMTLDLRSLQQSISAILPVRHKLIRPTASNQLIFGLLNRDKTPTAGLESKYCLPSSKSVSISPQQTTNYRSAHSLCRSISTLSFSSNENSISDATYSSQVITGISKATSIGTAIFVPVPSNIHWRSWATKWFTWPTMQFRKRDKNTVALRKETRSPTASFRSTSIWSTLTVNVTLKNTYYRRSRNTLELLCKLPQRSWMLIDVATLLNSLGWTFSWMKV